MHHRCRNFRFIIFTIITPIASYVNKINLLKTSGISPIDLVTQQAMKHSIAKNQSISWQTMRERMEEISCFAPYRRIVDALGAEWPSLEVLNQYAQTFSPGLGLEFIPQIATNRSRRKDKTSSSSSLSSSSSSLRGYIQLIASEGLVPMRHQSIHDLFNYMTFLLFPKSKLALMKIHQTESELLAKAPTPPAGGRGRSRLQDLATLFDEGGSIAYGQKPEDLLVFGHGVLEQFIYEPRRVRAFCWQPRQLSSDSEHMIANLDQELAQDIGAVAPFQDPSRFSGQWIPDSLSFPGNSP